MVCSSRGGVENFPNAVSVQAPPVLARGAKTRRHRRKPLITPKGIILAKGEKTKRIRYREPNPPLKRGPPPILERLSSW